jgi:hypothetical protein
MVKRENQHVAHGRIVIGITIALLSVAACAGPVTQAGPGGLPGMWQGSFNHPGADYTSPSRADLTLRINSDSTYTLKWGSRAETTGTIADQGNRVVLNDSSGTPRRLAGPRCRTGSTSGTAGTGQTSHGPQTPCGDLAVLGSEIHAAACFTLRLPCGFLVGGWLTDPV